MNTHPLVGFVRTAYGLLIRVASSLKCPFLLCVRLYWGWQFFQTGKGKLQHHDQVTEFFTTLHIPFPGPNATLVGLTECCGGLLLLVGAATRLAAIPLIVTLIVAYLTDGIEVVKNIFNEPDKFVTAEPFLFLFAATILLIFGPGAVSIDHFLRNKFGADASESTTQRVST